MTIISDDIEGGKKASVYVCEAAYVCRFYLLNYECFFKKYMLELINFLSATKFIEWPIFQTLVYMDALILWYNYHNTVILIWNELQKVVVLSEYMHCHCWEVT